MGPSAKSRIGLLALASVLAGLLVAGLALPAVGGMGLAAKQGLVSFENLPSDLKTPPLPQRSVIVAADGTYITSMFKEDRVNVSLDQVPEVMQKAIVAIEDSRFYQHNGVDPKGILRAFVANQQAGEITQGASTLTQQYVKRVLLQQADTEEEREAAAGLTRARKIREIRYALALEQRLSKDEILERYLNIAYFGAGAYGIGAAAQVFFDKPVDKLTLPEAAMLAGLVQAPSAYDPFKNKGKQALARRNVVLNRMAQVGYISQADADRAKATPLGLHPGHISNGCVNAKVGERFCAYVHQYLLNDPSFGPTQEAREAKLYKGGLTITTTLSPKLQQAAVKAVNDVTPRNKKFATGLVAIEPGTGKVRAMAMTRDYGKYQFPYLTGQLTSSDSGVVVNKSGKTQGYPAGSTFKMFTMLAALQQGIRLDKSYYSPYQYYSPVCYNGTVDKHYAPHNDNHHMVGTFDMRSGFGGSINTYFVQLEEKVGPDAAAKVADKVGLTSPAFDQVESHPYGHCAFTLGVTPVFPLEMANAYATIAARGKYCPPTPIVSIKDADGKKIELDTQPCKQVIKPEVADAATEAATWVINPPHLFTSGPTGTGARVGNRPVAGKTGTTQNEDNSWFVGFTPQLAASVVINDPDNPLGTEIPYSYRGQNDTAFGEFMRAAMQGQPVKQFVDPPRKLVYSPKPPPPPPSEDEDSSSDETSSSSHEGNSSDPDTKPSTTPSPSDQRTSSSESGGSTSSGSSGDSQQSSGDQKSTKKKDRKSHRGGNR